MITFLLMNLLIISCLTPSFQRYTIRLGYQKILPHSLTISSLTKLSSFTTLQLSTMISLTTYQLRFICVTTRLKRDLSNQLRLHDLLMLIVLKGLIWHWSVLTGMRYVPPLLVILTRP